MHPSEEARGQSICNTTLPITSSATATHNLTSCWTSVPFWFTPTSLPRLRQPLQITYISNFCYDINMKKAYVLRSSARQPKNKKASTLHFSRSHVVLFLSSVLSLFISVQVTHCLLPLSLSNPCPLHYRSASSSSSPCSCISHQAFSVSSHTESSFFALAFHRSPSSSRSLPSFLRCVFLFTVEHSTLDAICAFASCLLILCLCVMLKIISSSFFSSC